MNELVIYHPKRGSLTYKLGKHVPRIDDWITANARIDGRCHQLEGYVGEVQWLFTGDDNIKVTVRLN